MLIPTRKHALNFLKDVVGKSYFHLLRAKMKQVFNLASSARANETPSDSHFYSSNSLELTPSLLERWPHISNGATRMLLYLVLTCTGHVLDEERNGIVLLVILGVTYPGIREHRNKFVMTLRG